MEGIIMKFPVPTLPGYEYRISLFWGSQQAQIGCFSQSIHSMSTRLLDEAYKIDPKAPGAEFVRLEPSQLKTTRGYIESLQRAASGFYKESVPLNKELYDFIWKESTYSTVVNLLQRNCPGLIILGDNMTDNYATYNFTKRFIKYIIENKVGTVVASPLVFNKSHSTAPRMCQGFFWVPPLFEAMSLPCTTYEFTSRKISSEGGNVKFPAIEKWMEPYVDRSYKRPKTKKKVVSEEELFPF